MDKRTDGAVPQYNWNDIPKREMRRGVVQKIFRDDEQIFMILKGHVTLHAGDQVFGCPAGTVIRIPPNVEHWAGAPSDADGAALNMDVWTPLRPDYAKHTAYQTDTFSN